MFEREPAEVSNNTGYTRFWRRRCMVHDHDLVLCFMRKLGAGSQSVARAAHPLLANPTYSRHTYDPVSS